MTLGEERVRLNFNPSANTDVEDIKRRTADCIDWCDDKTKQDAEQARLFALAATYYELAGMLAVKAVTTGV